MGWIKNMIRNYLEIGEPSPNHIKIEPINTEEGKIFINKMWYRGEGVELEQLYNQITTVHGSNNFWGNKNANIRKIHTGLPAMIVDTLADIVTDDLSKIEVSKNQDVWDAVAKENHIKELIKEAVISVLWGGDGAFKWSYDPMISTLPIIEFYPADRVNYIYNRGRLNTIIFKTDKIINKKKYILYEYYKKEGIYFELYDKDGRKVSLDLLEELEKVEPIINNNNFMMALKFEIRPSHTIKGRGKSIFDGKLDNFDAFDEVWSQWMQAVRKGQIKEYIPRDLIPTDAYGNLMKRNDFNNDFVMIETAMGENSNARIETTQGQIQYDALLTTYITALDQCLTGLISPSTLGIDTKKIDNAEATREKEKTTLYKRNQIIDVLQKVIEEMVSITFNFINTLENKEIEDVETTVSFGGYANPSFEAQVETISKASTTNIMSIESQVEELWGDTKDIEWKKEEVKRIKEEKGIMEEEEPAVNDEIKQTEEAETIEEDEENAEEHN